MTKDNLQKELKEKVKEGVKPSDIKRLKRSKSLNDLPNNSTETTEMFIDAPEETNEELKTKINELEKQLSETQTELDNANQSRLKALQDFDKQQEKIKQLENEVSEKQKDLESTAEYGSEQIIKLEKINRELKREKSLLAEQLKFTKQDLSNYQRINELRLQKPELGDDWWDKYGTIIPLLVLGTLIILLSSKNKHH